MDCFKNLVLISSHQDKYVPFDSARIQICKSEPASHVEMANNLLGKLQLKVVYRLDVNFNIVDSSVDSWIGRTAHI